MKILEIGTTDIIGGAAKIGWSLKTELEKMGHEVSLFVADKLSNDPKVKIIPRIKWRKILGFLFSSEDFIKTDWILKTREFKEADLIHCHNLHGRFFNQSTLQKMSLQKPVVWTLHDEWAITPHCSCTFENKTIKNGLFVCPNIDIPPRLLWNNTKYLSWRKNNLYKKSKLNIITPSNWLKKRVEKTVLKEQNIQTIHNGINTKIFKPKEKLESRKKLNLPPEKKIILFLADNSKDSPWKGWSYTQKIIEKYKDDKNMLFLNVGNPAKIKDLDNVKFIERINDPEIISQYYNAADLFLFTSIAENFPLVILESMACGTPVVSFDVGGVKEALTHKENGYLAEYRNINSLLEGIEYILSLNDSQLKKIENFSSTKIKYSFSTEIMTSKYIDLYKQLLNKND